MSKTLILLVITLLAGCETMNDHPAEMRKMINWGKCSDAEAYAKRNFREEYLSWSLGNVALECRKNRNLAIRYYTAGARAKSQFSHLSVNALTSMGEKSPVSQQDIALQQCFDKANREEQTCALIAYGGVSSIGNPIVRERQQICTDRRMSAEEHCLRMHKPSALQGVPARVPIPQSAQPQQIIIQQQPMKNPNACIQDGGGIFCPNYRR
jgi:hypothetical protein